MSSHYWSHLPDPCLLTVFKHITLTGLICAIRLVCKRWSLLASSELNQRLTLVISSDWMVDNYYFESITRSHLLKHLRYEDGQLPLLKYHPIDDRDVVKFSEKNLFVEPFATVLEKNLSNINKLTLVLGYINNSDNVTKCEFTPLIRILTYWRNNLITLNLSMGTWIGDENQVEPNVETLFNSINRLESLKHLKLDLEFDYDHDQTALSPTMLTILPQLKTFTFSSWYDNDIQIDMLNHLEKNCLSCEIGFEIHYSKLREEWLNAPERSELNHIARFGSKFASKFVNLSIMGELGLKCYKNLLSIGSKFKSLKYMELSIDRTFLMSMLARCLSQLPQLINLKLVIQNNQIPHEHIPVHNIAQVSSVRLLTLDIETRSHRDTARLYLAHIFPKLQVLDLHHSSVVCQDCHYDFRKVTLQDSTRQSLDAEVKSEEQILILKCMRKAREPFRGWVQLHTVEFNDAPFGYRNRKVVSKDEFFL